MYSQIMLASVWRMDWNEAKRSMEHLLVVFHLQVIEIQLKLVPAIKECIDSCKPKRLGVFGFRYRWTQELKTSQDLELNYLLS